MAKKAADSDESGLDLMVALGTPEGDEGDEGGYLDSKDPVLVGHLMDAVDDSRTPEQRAEALCRAIEASRSPAPDMGGMMSEDLPPDADY